MFGKLLRLIVILAAALGLPFVWFNEPLADSLKKKWESWNSRRGSVIDSERLASLARRSPEGEAAVVPTLVGIPTNGLDEVLRFEITSAWIVQNWARVSNVRASEGYEGLRVPLVTGIDRDDFAGSLTYYFDRNGQVQRIVLTGTTGDEQKLVQIATERFGLVPDPGLGTGVYVARWNGEPKSLLRVRNAPVLRADMPHTNRDVLLELNRPSVGFQLSPKAQAALAPATRLPARPAAG